MIEELYSMKLHDILTVSEGLKIIRVPGGWMYIFEDGLPAFVPFSKEFQQKEKISSYLTPEKKEPKDVLVFPFVTSTFICAWKEWITDRKERKLKTYTFRGEQGALHNLQKISNNNHDTAIKIINQSVINGWQGLFPLKNNQSNGQTTEEDATYFREKFS